MNYDVPTQSSRSTHSKHHIKINIRYLDMYYLVFSHYVGTISSKQLQKVIIINIYKKLNYLNYHYGIIIILQVF